MIMLEMNFVERPSSPDEINNIFEKINVILNKKENEVL